MNTAYFLTGSYKDADNDFELTIAVTDQNTTQSGDQYNVVLTDISSENTLIWQTAQPSFLSCLNDMDDFITENNITLYSKILTATRRDDAVDKELEGFILNKAGILNSALV